MLTDKEKRFCEEYVKYHDATKAYKAIEPNAKSPAPRASEWMKKDRIKNYITELEDEVTKRNNVQIDDIVQEFKKIAFFNPQSLLNEDGKIARIEDLPPNVAAAIQELKVQKDGTLVYKFHSKQAALDSLAKYKHMYNDEKDTKDVNLFLKTMQQCTTKKN